MILTGFDDDHSDVVGASIVLRKYRPDWVMYPKYYKRVARRKGCSPLLMKRRSSEEGRQNHYNRYSVRIDQLANRQLAGLSDNFDFELFSPISRTWIAPIIAASS